MAASIMFVWKGRSPKGEILSGEYEATDKHEVSEYLRKRRIIITTIRKKPKNLRFGFGGAARSRCGT